MPLFCQRMSVASLEPYSLRFASQTYEPRLRPGPNTQRLTKRNVCAPGAGHRATVPGAQCRVSTRRRLRQATPALYARRMNRALRPALRYRSGPANGQPAPCGRKGHPYPGIRRKNRPTPRLSPQPGVPGPSPRWHRVERSVTVPRLLGMGKAHVSEAQLTPLSAWLDWACG